jgi:hypothetical protein
MVLIDDGGTTGGPSGGEDVLLASEAGRTTTYDGMVLLPDDGVPASRHDDAILAGPPGDDEIAGAEPAAGRGD